jgi:hypothetical protein
MRRPSASTIIASVALFFSLAGASASASTTRTAGLVTAVARWAAHQNGHVVAARRWPVNRHRELVTVEFPITFEPSGLVGTETETILAWRSPAWWIAEMRPLGVAPFMGVNMRTLGSHLVYPSGTTPAGPPTIG